MHTHVYFSVCLSVRLSDALLIFHFLVFLNFFFIYSHLLYLHLYTSLRFDKLLLINEHDNKRFCISFEVIMNILKLMHLFLDKFSM